MSVSVSQLTRTRVREGSRPYSVPRSIPLQLTRTRVREGFSRRLTGPGHSNFNSRAPWYAKEKCAAGVNAGVNQKISIHAHLGREGRKGKTFFSSFYSRAPVYARKSRNMKLRAISIHAHRCARMGGVKHPVALCSFLLTRTGMRRLMS